MMAMKKTVADKVKISVQELPTYSPKAILDAAKIPWNDVRTIDASAIHVSENLYKMWQENWSEDKSWEDVGPTLDAALPEDTISIIKDNITMTTPDEEFLGEPNDESDKIKDVNEDESEGFTGEGLTEKTQGEGEETMHVGGGLKEVRYFPTKWAWQQWLEKEGSKGEIRRTEELTGDGSIKVTHYLPKGVN